MQTWFITGATGGLASEVIQELLERGDRVAATSRKLGALDSLKEKYGSQLWQTTLDLTNEAEVNAVVAQAFTELGTIDVLLNNAAYGLYGAIEEISEQQMKNVFEINLFGSLRTAKAFLPFFRKQGHGQIIQISSMAGHYSTPAMGLYSASKWAVEAAFEALAEEVKPFNIQTTIVDPGGIRTNFVSGNGAFGEQLEVYQNTEVGQVISMMKGEVPGLDIAAFKKMIVGDPAKMAHQIIELTDQKTNALRIALGSDSYQKIHESLAKRLSSLEAQKELAYSTDAD